MSDSTPVNNAKILNVQSLNIFFTSSKSKLNVVHDLSFSLQKNEILGIVGESGCGKSVTCLAIGRLLNESTAKIEGKVLYGETDLLTLSESKMRQYRGHKIAYIFQEPTLCLNPVKRIGEQIKEVLELHGLTHQNPKLRVLELMKKVGIPAPEIRINCFPHELSGGMQQRIVIAMALAGEPEILIADEPTTALDVTVQAQILKLLKQIQRHDQMSILLITHNFGLIGELADRVMVMYAGEAIETGLKEDIIQSPKHPYTQALLKAVPKLGENEKLCAINGRVPSPNQYPTGCRFAPRCPQKTPECDMPIEVEIISKTHSVKCRRYHV